VIEKLKMQSNLIDFLSHNFSVLDGGFATYLELQNDVNINTTSLWSSSYLITNPELVKQCHYEYFSAGADIVISNTYQASMEGFQRYFSDLTDNEIKETMRKGVILCCEARSQYLEENPDCERRKFVCCSLGSFGAFLGDGSEYTGSFSSSMTKEELFDWHYRRWEVYLPMVEKEVDLLFGCETIPSLYEAQVMLDCLYSLPKPSSKQIYAYISFSLKDSTTLNSGDLFEDTILRLLEVEKEYLSNLEEEEEEPRLIGFGINCSSPSLISNSIQLIKTMLDENSKILFVYPNSGEEWDAVNKEWIEIEKDENDEQVGNDQEFVNLAKEWKYLGVNGIGGCCRTTPTTIQLLSQEVRS